MKKLFIISLITLSSANCSKGEYTCESNNSNTIGANCNDGTRSNSTGSGTCSSHGGVKN